MRLWDLKAFAYHGARRLPGIRWILDAEIRNLRSLAGRIPVFPEPAADAGTGAGSTLCVFPEPVKLVCVDRSSAMLARAARRRAIQPVAGDLRRLPFRKNGLGFLSAIGVCEYLPDPLDFPFEAARVLKPGAYFLVTVPRPGILTLPRNLLGHRLRTVRQDAWEKALTGAGFTIIGKESSLFQIQYLTKKSERRR
ncbi:MAG: methyltransferase domain-containing protein [bacterium]|nr:methyltransferase domain-containing protein [bacterium]